MHSTMYWVSLPAGIALPSWVFARNLEGFKSLWVGDYNDQYWREWLLVPIVQ